MAWETNARLRFRLKDDSSWLTLDSAEITEFAAKPEPAEDGRGWECVHARLAGRALLTDSEDVYAAFRARVLAGVDVYNPMQFVAEVRRDGSASWVTVLEWTADYADNKGGPRVVLGAPQAFGINAMIVEFSAELFAPFADDPADALPAVSHTWTQTWEVAEDERLVRVVRGTLRLAPATVNGSLAPASNAPATGGALALWKNKNPIPDLFRRAIIPALPDDTWMREPGQFVVGNDYLAYEVRDVQRRVANPWPARVAEYSFRYERGMPNIGQALLTMRVRMEANLAITTRQLAVVLFALMKIRVDPVGNLMQSLSIEEKDIGGRVELEAEMRVLAFAKDNMTTPTGSLAIAAMFGQPFTITNPAGWNTGNSALDPYGAYQHRWWGNTEWMVEQLGAALLRAGTAPAAMPVAVATAVTDSGPAIVTTAATVTVAPSTTDLASINASFGGAYTQPFPVLADTGSGANTAASLHAHAKGTASVRYRTGMVRLCTADTGINSATAADRVYQTETPYVEVSETVEVVRSNQEPPKGLRPAPTGAINVEEGMEAGSGSSDAQGNRAWPCVFRRSYIVLDPGTDGNGWSTVGGRRQWTPPNGYLLCGYSPAYDTDSQTSAASVIGATTDTRQRITYATNPIVAT